MSTNNIERVEASVSFSVRNGKDVIEFQTRTAVARGNSPAGDLAHNALDRAKAQITAYLEKTPNLAGKLKVTSVMVSIDVSYQDAASDDVAADTAWYASDGDEDAQFLARNSLAMAGYNAQEMIRDRVRGWTEAGSSGPATA